MADTKDEVETMLKQQGIKYSKQSTEGGHKYIAPYSTKRATIFVSTTTNTYYFIVRRVKNVDGAVRLQLAKIMQQLNLKLKLGSFQIDMNDGEVLFTIQHRNYSKESCVSQLQILWGVSHATYDEYMEKIVAQVAQANPGVVVDKEAATLSDLDSDVLVQLLAGVLREKKQTDAGGTKGGGGGSGDKETSGEAHLELILQLLRMQQALPPTMKGPDAFSATFASDMDQFIIDASEVEFFKVDGKPKELGSGAFGVVFHGRIFETIEVAIKRITYKGHASYEEFKKEARVMRQLHNNNIVTFCGVSIIDNQLCIISEYCNQGSLASYLKKDGITISTALAMAKEAAIALNFLHKKKFIHRDIKPGNILVHDGHVKLADFGLTLLVQNASDAPCGGTIFYMAPEMFLKGETTSKVDVFAYGVVLWELLHPSQQLYPMYRSRMEYEMNVVRMSKRMDISTDIPLSLRELVEECWAADPEERPTMAQVFTKLTEIGKEIQDAKIPPQSPPQLHKAPPTTTQKGPSSAPPPKQDKSICSIQ